MIYAFLKDDLGFKKVSLSINERIENNIIWFDLLNPSTNELEFIKDNFKINIPTENERLGIEESTRYWEEDESITINSTFLNKQINEDGKINKEIVSFIIKNNILFTVRFTELPTFIAVENIVLANYKHYMSVYDILDQIFDIRIDKDGDLLEKIDEDARKLKMDILEQKSTPNYEFFLKKISNLQEINIQVRYSLFEKKKIIISLMKSDKVNSVIKEGLGILSADVVSLIEFNMSLFNILDNIQSILASKIDIEQNKIIKLFTVVTVAMMPPTLISSIYGMNFEHMPELKFTYSYPIVLCVMILSIVLPIMFFKKKRWL